MRLLIDDLNHLRGELALTLAGLATSLATAAIVVVGVLVLRVDLSSLSLSVVVPVGAIGAGMLAASGYGFAASRIDHRPGVQLLINMALIAASTFFVIRYAMYRVAHFADGTVVADQVTFWRYYLMSIANKEIVFRRDLSNPIGGLGSVAYALEAVEFAGFLAGAALQYRDLWRRKPNVRVASRRKFARDRSRTINCRRCNTDVVLRTCISMEPRDSVLRFLHSIDAASITPAADRGSAREPIVYSVRTATCTSCGLEHQEVVTHYKTHAVTALHHQPGFVNQSRQLTHSDVRAETPRNQSVQPTGFCPVCRSHVVFNTDRPGDRQFCVNGHVVTFGHLSVDE